MTRCLALLAKQMCPSRLGCMSETDPAQTESSTIRLTSVGRIKRTADLTLSPKGFSLRSEDGRIASVPDVHQFHSQAMFLQAKPKATLMINAWKQGFEIPDDLFGKIMLRLGPEEFIRIDLRQMMKHGVIVPLTLFGLNAYEIFSNALINTMNAVVAAMSLFHLIITLWGSFRPQIWLLRGFVVLNTGYASLFCFIAYDRGQWGFYLLSAFMAIIAFSLNGRAELLDKVRTIKSDLDSVRTMT